jgi:tetratricopeptide (TPR) repeat protein
MDTNLANAYQEVGRFEDSIKTYKHALELNPDNPSTHCNLGYGLLRIGRLDEAIQHFMDALRLDPAMDVARHDLAKALEARGIDLSAPEQPKLDGTYGFDLHEALQLLGNAPAPPPGQ